MNIKNKTVLLGFLLLSWSRLSQAQDIDQLLNEADNTKTNFTTATFKSTRIIAGHSIERMQAGQLDFRISHHFGKINSGAYNLWGLDNAFIHFSLEYGITDRLMVGAGRGTYEKTFDGFVNYSILRQSSGEKNMPVSLSLFFSAAINTLNDQALGISKVYFSSRLSYVYQVLVARKFNENFSFEINPTLVHRNLVDTELDPNDMGAIGLGGRYKLSKRISVNAEYYYVIPPLHDYRSTKTYPPLSLGVDIETGGHVFQLFLSNSQAMIEKGFITETNSRWGNGGIFFGFNISRVFALR